MHTYRLLLVLDVGNLLKIRYTLHLRRLFYVYLMTRGWYYVVTLMHVQVV